MPWLIGIDEAGYGPNLGPLVMTSVACHLPPDLNDANLWHTLAAAVRRVEDPADDRLLIADSKVVYSTGRGLHGLESGVRAALPLADRGTLAGLIEAWSPAGTIELQREAWYTGASEMPVECQHDDLAPVRERFGTTCQDKQVAWGLVRSVVICPPRFNALLDRFDSKGAVLGQGLTELLHANLANGDGEPLAFFIDKHGGRNTYAAMLQDALPEGFVVVHEEGMQRSIYSVQGGERAVRLTFQPRADAEHFCVALASMVSKYLREVLMREFNAFWQTHVPGLKPTAGYPNDAVRFYQAIRPAREKLGIADDAVWRRK